MVSTSMPDATQYLINATADLCALRIEETIPMSSGLYCNRTWDTYLCWPPTPANTIVRQRCPVGNGLDITKYVERRCSADGEWEIRPNATRLQYPNGWTNFTPCFSREMIQLLNKLYAGGNEDVANMKIMIAERTRTLEMIGFSLSLFALIISLVIFCNFRSLRNTRTKIHKNLFIAMVIQVIIRLTLYLDQAIIRNRNKLMNETLIGIENTPYLCEGSYVLLEYARTAMFMWMFIEGLYLHNVVTVTVFHGRFPHFIYSLLGWGLPVLMTTIWAIFTSNYKQGQKCWWGYNFTSIYYILEGPRLAVLLLNFIFLLNIIRVLIVKLRQSHTSDIEQVRKAVRAAIVLIPLLGITNILNMTEAPLHRTAFEFALWSYTTHFLVSFQGLFIATIYCFLNNEVRAAIVKSVGVYMSLRGNLDWLPRRHSMFSAGIPDANIPQNDLNNRNGQIRTRHRNWITMCFSEHKVFKGNDAKMQRQPPETSV